MVKIEAIIRPEKLDSIKDALANIGIMGLSTYQVKGRGRQMGYLLTFRGKEYRVDLLPKIKIELVVDDDHLEETLNTIQEKAFTGNIGDGKIFVYPIERAIRIRTGEQGKEAI